MSGCATVHKALNGRIRLSVSTASRTYELSEETHVTHSVRTDFIRLGSVATNRKNGLTGEQLVVGTDSRSVSTGPSRMFSLFTDGCHVAYSRESVGTVCCTYGQSNTTNVRDRCLAFPSSPWCLGSKSRLLKFTAIPGGISILKPNLARL